MLLFTHLCHGQVLYFDALVAHLRFDGLSNLKLVEELGRVCGFEEGEVRVVSVESQPLFGPTMHWRVYDGAKGKIAEGKTKMADYTEHQPYPTGDVAAALSGGSSQSSPDPA